LNERQGYQGSVLTVQLAQAIQLSEYLSPQQYN
jgi:hypothetical protein